MHSRDYCGLMAQQCTCTHWVNPYAYIVQHVSAYDSLRVPFLQRHGGGCGMTYCCCSYKATCWTARWRSKHWQGKRHMQGHTWCQVPHRFKLPNQLVSSLHGGMGSLNTQVQGLYARGSVVQKEPAGPDLAGAGSSAQQLGTLPLRM